MKNFKWNIPPIPNHSGVKNGDLRLVTLPVRVVFEWSDKIVKEVDDVGNVVEYTEGFLMHVSPNQLFIYEGERTQFIANAVLKK